MTAVPSSVVWVRWLSPPKGSEIGEIDRLPRVLAEVFIERGDALPMLECEVPADVRRRGGTAA